MRKILFSFFISVESLIGSALYLELNERQMLLMVEFGPLILLRGCKACLNSLIFLIPVCSNLPEHTYLSFPSKIKHVFVSCFKHSKSGIVINKNKSNGGFSEISS